MQQLHEQVHGVVVGEVGGEVHCEGVRLGLDGSYWSSGLWGRTGALRRFVLLIFGEYFVSRRKWFVEVCL